MCNKIKMRTYADLHIETVTARGTATGMGTGMGTAAAAAAMATSYDEVGKQ